MDVYEETEIFSAYPMAFVIVICIIFILEMIAGLSMNLYNIYRWYKMKVKKRFGFKNLSGNNFIINLKFLDVFICSVVIPFALTVQVIQPQNNLVPCLLKEGLIILASASSSLGVLLVSVDRYAAVVMPLKPIMTPFRKTVCRISLVLYGILGAALPLLCFTMGAYKFGVIESSKFKSCRHVVWNFKPFYLYDLYYIASFVVAMTTTVFCYRAVLRVVRERLVFRISRMASTSEDTDFTSFKKQEIKAHRVAFAVVLSFLICWGPHAVITVVQLVILKSVEIDMIQACGLVLAFLSPIAHSMIYSYEARDTQKTNITIHGIIMGIKKARAGAKVTPATMPSTRTNRPTAIQTIS